MKKKKNLLKYSIVTLILLWSSSNINWGGQNWDSIIIYDVKGYYSYLPAIFIYDDLNFGFFEEIEVKYFNQNYGSDYRTEIEEDVYVNKYYVGTAILELPFFIIGHFISGALGGDLDGYSKYYAILVNISSVFFLILGIFFFQKILMTFNVSHKNQWIVMLSIIFGTNAFVYAVPDPGMSHIYSFACINALIYFGYKFKESGRWFFFLMICLLFGIIILIRPINLLVLLGLPFFIGSVEEIKEVSRKAINLGYKGGMSILSIVLIASIQLIIYKIQTGHWIVYSYQDEGFNFLKPEIFNFLISYRKGYFLYTPLALLSLLGLIPIYLKSKFQFWSLTLFLMLLIYILSSWWCWWYGGSFSSRVMLEYSVFIFVPLGILLEKVNLKKLYKSLVSLIVILILICQIQIYQFRHFQIHWSAMTKEQYWDNFLRIDKLVK